MYHSYMPFKFFLNTQKCVLWIRIGPVSGHLNISLFLWKFANNKNTFFCLKKQCPLKVYIQNAKTVAVKCRKCLAERKISRRGGGEGKKSQLRTIPLSLDLFSLQEPYHRQYFPLTKYIVKFDYQ